MTDKTPKKIVWPSGVQDVTEENLGKTIVIIGYPRPSKPTSKPIEDEVEIAIDETEEDDPDEQV